MQRTKRELCLYCLAILKLSKALSDLHEDKCGIGVLKLCKHEMIIRQYLYQAC